MVLKKFYGNNIQEALRDAREQLGEEVILLESTKAEGERPACVTVMLDKQLASVQSVGEEEQTEFRNVFYQRSSARPPKNGIEASQQKRPPIEEKSELEIPNAKPLKRTATEPIKEKKEKQPEEDKVAPKAPQKPRIEHGSDDLPEPRGLDEEMVPMSRRKTPLIEIRQEPPSGSGYVSDAGVSREIAALHKRLERFESMLSDSLISANLDYAAHPIFQQLLQTGIRSTTIASWFKNLLNQGIDPYEHQEDFTFEISKIIRDALTVTLPQVAQPNMVFVGSSAAGKTTLIMKLASSPEFYREKRVAIVSVEPRSGSKYYSVLEQFCADEGIPFYRVNDGIEVSKLMPKLVEYDQVLIDTPSISLEKKTAFRDYWKIRQILASVLPLEVHFVVNATLENRYFQEEYAVNHPLQPDYLAITHLDETNRWGHLLPFMKTLGCAVRFISLGNEIPGGISAFSPTWFAEKLLKKDS